MCFDLNCEAILHIQNDQRTITLRYSLILCKIYEGLSSYFLFSRSKPKQSHCKSTVKKRVHSKCGRQGKRNGGRPLRCCRCASKALEDKL